MTGQETFRQGNDEINLLDYWEVIWKRRKFVAALCGGAILVSLVYSLLTPKLYQATATTLPPRESGFGAGNPISLSLGGQGGDLDSLLLGQLGSAGLFSFRAPTPSRDTYVAILKSRTMHEEVIDHFRKTWGPSVKSLVPRPSVLVSKEGIISVTLETRDPKLSAEVANFYLDNLSAMLARRALNQVNQQVEYYERQLEQTQKDLKEAQNAFIEFQEKNRYIGLDPATKSAIEMGAMQAGGVMALEMERNVKRMFLTDHHPEMIVLTRRIYEAKRLVSHQLYGEPQELPPEKPGSPPRKEFFVARAKMTPLQFKLIEVYRNLKSREALWSYINHSIQTLQYTKENPVGIHVDWLDRAIPPEKPSWPKFPYILAAAGIGSLVIGIFMALFLEYIERQRALGAVKGQ